MAYKDKVWSKDDKFLLKTMYEEGVSRKNMAEHFGRTVSAISNMINKLELPSKKRAYGLSPGQMVEKAIKKGWYKFKVEDEFMCVVLARRMRVGEFRQSELNQFKQVIQMELDGRISLFGYLSDKLLRDPVREDVEKFWQEFIVKYS